MSNLRRYFFKGNTCFISNVTYNREKILINNFKLLSESIRNTKNKTPFEMIAWVILPDHFHFLIDPLENDPSRLIQRIKMSFGVLYRVKKGIRLGRVWQNRFWDHIIRDQNDLNRHIDYIHYNPVKHGCVSKPKDWPHSSFRHYVKAGVYQDDWGAVPIVGMDNDFGE